MQEPTNNLFFAKSWAQESTGAHEAPAALKPPAALTKGDAAPFALDSMLVTNHYPDTFAKPSIVKRIFMNPLTDGAQMRYNDGDILFVYKPKSTLDSNTYTVFALPNLNHLLEMAHGTGLTGGIVYAGMERRGGEGGGGGSQARRAEKYDYPTTIDEFVRNVYLLGVYRSELKEKKGVRRRVAGVTVSGRALVDNHWGEMRPGDTVGFYCKEFPNTQPTQIDWEGKTIGDATPGPFLQVKGYWESTCHNPIHCSSGAGTPQENDLDFVETRVIPQSTYAMDDPRTGTNLLDWAKGSSDSNVVRTMIAKVYQQGAYFKLGRVLRINKTPTPMDIEAAERTFDGGARLRKNGATVDVDVNMRMFPLLG